MTVDEPRSFHVYVRKPKTYCKSPVTPVAGSKSPIFPIDTCRGLVTQDDPSVTTVSVRRWTVSLVVLIPSVGCGTLLRNCQKTHSYQGNHVFILGYVHDANTGIVVGCHYLWTPWVTINDHQPTFLLFPSHDGNVNLSTVFLNQSEHGWFVNLSYLSIHLIYQPLRKWTIF